MIIFFLPVLMAVLISPVVLRWYYGDQPVEDMPDIEAPDVEAATDALGMIPHDRDRGEVWTATKIGALPGHGPMHQVAWSTTGSSPATFVVIKA